MKLPVELENCMDLSRIAAFKQLVESAPILCFILGSDFKYLYVNPFFETIHHVKPSEIFGLHAADVIGKAGFEGNLERYKRVLKGETIRYDSSFIKSDGNPHHYHAVYEPLWEGEEIIGFTGVVVDTTAEKELYRLSRTDSLTQLSNRREFESDLAGLLMGISTSLYGLILLDIDFFKKINDDFGHEIGDKALIKLGEFLNYAVGISDKVYRIGGEEFAIIVNNIRGEEELKIKAENLCKKVASSQILEERKLTISIGATLFHSNSNRSKILKNADIALYSSKNKGRNQAQIINENMK